MKTYQYQILRYFHDLVTEEFVNVGIVIFSNKDKYLDSKFITKYRRISKFYSGHITNNLLKNLRDLEIKLVKLNSDIKDKLPFDNYKDIKSITSKVLPIDDSALQFSEIKTGITLNYDFTLNDLFERIVNKYEITEERKSRSDEDAERIIYKDYFAKYGITNKLSKKEIITANDKFEFEGWKNGIWHCYKPISLDYLDESSIRSKVYRWAGIKDELQTAGENFKLFILALNPNQKFKSELKNFIIKKLQLENNSHKIEVIPEEQFERFTNRVSKEIEDVH